MDKIYQFYDAHFDSEGQIKKEVTMLHEHFCYKVFYITLLETRASIYGIKR